MLYNVAGALLAHVHTCIGLTQQHSPLEECTWVSECPTKGGPIGECVKGLESGVLE